MQPERSPGLARRSSLAWRRHRYEGLVNNGQLHSHGVLRFPSKDRCDQRAQHARPAGALRDCCLRSAAVLARGRDALSTAAPDRTRYEGEFEDGVMEGYGVYVWADGTWVARERHGGLGGGGAPRRG